MAPLPKNSIDHFTHAHPLVVADIDREFSCDGCKTLGIGKRYRCNGCDFDLHDYCGTCPRTLSAASMHHHALTLVMRKADAKTRQVDRICDVCRDPVDGLFYRCRECEFDVHPLCTQLPEKLNHALHNTHPLILQSSPAAGFCTVCRRSCGGWRYRCGICCFDIHLECVMEPVVPFEQTGQRGIPAFDQGIPFQQRPQFAPFYGYPCGPGYPNSGPGFNMYYGGPYMYPPGNYAQQNFQVGASNNNESSRVGRSMFGLVKRLGFGVISNMIFGVDVSPLFAGSG
ncbi:hypothetical protein C2S51_031073 [Perilla frutescens var. frutescens]|nr:hypothetical protein C2S51_031073 [Perilla frutescens var. frutescens]